MSTTSAPAAIPATASPTPTELSISQILQAEAWRSPTPTSVPDNTPEEPPTPQLARRTNPMIEEESVYLPHEPHTQVRFPPIRKDLGYQCHGRDALPTWDSIAYWERGTKGPGSGFRVRVAEGQL